jgi:hypothetical protein
MSRTFLFQLRPLQRAAPSRYNHPMDDQPSFRHFLLPALILFLAGWGALALLLNLTVPTLWPRWWFFALLVMAVTGTALPVSYFFNRRFPSMPPASPQAIIREALWSGIYFATLAWLSMGRVLTIAVGMWIAVGLIVIEYLIRAREKTLRG